MKRLKSDPTLLAEVRSYGAFDTNACYQCGSCTISCNLTNGSATFPRRTIRQTLLGLKTSLLSSLEPWLCYYCGDCSTTCPREAEPGEAMMTLRRFLTSQYDWTGISSRIYRSRSWEIGLLSIVAVLFLLLVAGYHLYIVELKLSDFVTESMGMEHMFDLIDSFTLWVFLIPVLFLLSNAARMYWLVMHRGSEIKIPLKLYFLEIKTFVLQAFTQKKYRECEDNRRWFMHLSLVFGCLLMFVLLLFFLEWFQTDNIYSISHPQRWLGYAATIALVFGSGEILIGRMRKTDQLHRFSNQSDWVLPILLLLTAMSGIVVHIFRYMEYEMLTHYSYAVHLAIAVPMLIIEIPFGKWSHMIYRPLAIYFQKIKDRAILNELQKEESVEHVE